MIEDLQPLVGMLWTIMQSLEQSTRVAAVQSLARELVVLRAKINGYVPSESEIQTLIERAVFVVDAVQDACEPDEEPEESPVEQERKSSSALTPEEVEFLIRDHKE